MVSTFSFALAMADFVTGYINRSPTLRRMRRHFHEYRATLRSILPFKSKNFIELIKTATGAELYQEKEELVSPCWAVFVVICPPLMRRLLELRVIDLEKKLAKLQAKPLGNQTRTSRDIGLKKARKSLKRATFDKLGDTTAPFDEYGKCFKAKVDENDEKRNCHGLRDLFNYVGQRCRGLSNWSPHVARSEHVTLFVQDCVSKGISRTFQVFLNFAARARLGWLTLGVWV